MAKPRIIETVVSDDVIDKKIRVLSRKNQEFENGRAKKESKNRTEKIYQEDERPDEVADRIKEKIIHTEFEEWQIMSIIDLIKKERVNQAVGKLSELIELSEKEKQHFLDLPKETVLSWFKKYIDKE